MPFRISCLCLAGALVAPARADIHAQTQPAEVEVTSVRRGVHMISGVGGNIAAFIGEDGVFLVDAGLAEPVEQTLTAIQDLIRRESSNSDLAYVVNTHWHFDHTGGNERLATAGAVVVAHENVLRLVSEEQVMPALGDHRVPAAPLGGRPTLTFNDRVNLSWNGDLIHVVHIPDAHSNGDAIVHFRDADVVHVGDIFFNGVYPFIDVDFGGNIGGMVSAIEEILAHTNTTTLFIPGHGPLADRADFVRYRDMLATVRDRVQEMIDQGKTRDEIIAAKPTADLDDDWGGRDVDVWVGLVFDGMLRSR